MEKPKYDTIRGLSPTISIEQKAASNNPRSTVGTITEVHDYLRVLYASIGVQHCPSCGRPVGKQTSQQIVETILEMPEGARILVLAPLVQNRKGEYRELLGDAHKRGFSRVRVDGAVHSLEERLSLDKKLKHDIELVVDRLVVKEGIRGRLTDSVETALREGKGTLVVADADKEQKVGPGIDPEGYKAGARRAAALGCEGKWAIHPSQVTLANEVFSPTEAEVTKARRIIEELRMAQAQGKGAASLDGKMIDAASERMAANVLVVADAIAGK
jgi:excinuclease ABC subunit A